MKKREAKKIIEDWDKSGYPRQCGQALGTLKYSAEKVRDAMRAEQLASLRRNHPKRRFG